MTNKLMFIFLSSFLLLSGVGSTQTQESSEAVRNAKAIQKEKYEVCQKAYRFWSSEVKRISSSSVKRSANLSAAQEKVDKLTDEAKELVSEEYLQSLIAKESKSVKEKNEITRTRQQIIDKDENSKAQNFAAWEADQAEKARLAQERINLARVAAEAQVRRDRETMGVLTRGKYDRIREGMTLFEVEKILGPGVNYESDGDAQGYKWICREGNGTVIVILDRNHMVAEDGKVARWTTGRLEVEVP